MLTSQSRLFHVAAIAAAILVTGSAFARAVDGSTDGATTASVQYRAAAEQFERQAQELDSNADKNDALAKQYRNASLVSKQSVALLNLSRKYERTAAMLRADAQMARDSSAAQLSMAEAAAVGAR